MVPEEERLSKDISYLWLWQPFFSVLPNHLCNYDSGHYAEHLSEIILNLEQWFKRKCSLKIFLIYSPGGPFVQQSRTVCAVFNKGFVRNNSVKLL